MLLPHLRPLWRDRTTLQLGTDPSRAVVLEFADPAAARLVDLLDGSHTERVLLNAAAAQGIAATLAHDVIGTLRDAGVVIDAYALLPRELSPEERQRLYPEAAALALRAEETGRTPATVLRRRQGAHVLVGGVLGHPDGVEPLAALVADTLTAAGVGRVSPSRTDPIPRTGDTFVVRVGTERRPAALVARAYAQRGVAHITVAVRDGVVVVGPLVPPAGSPCLSCLDLHRTDRDPAWPSLAAQLATGSEQPLTCAATTRVTAAAYVADEVLAYLDGLPARTRGASVEVSGPDRFRRRTWPPHPRCDCRRGRRTAVRAQEST